MKCPTTPEELKYEIELSASQHGDLRIRQLINILKKVDDEIIIEGVFQTIEDKSNLYLTQNCAGRILSELKPNTKKELEGFILRILGNWDKSCEEIPFWMNEQYGIEHIRNLIREIEKKKLTPIELDKLKTIKWWLKIK